MTKPKWYHYLLAAGSQDPDNPTARMYSPSEEARAYAEGDDKKIGQMHNDQLAYEKAVAPAKAVTAAAALAVPYVPHILKVLANPMAAKTTAGMLTASGLDAAGTIYGLNRNSDLINKWASGKFDKTNPLDYTEPVEFGLNLIPGYTLTRGFNYGVDMAKIAKEYIKKGYETAKMLKPGYSKDALIKAAELSKRASNIHYKIIDQERLIEELKNDVLHNNLDIFNDIVGVKTALNKYGIEYNKIRRVSPEHLQIELPNQIKAQSLQNSDLPTGDEIILKAPYTLVDIKKIPRKSSLEGVPFEITSRMIGSPLSSSMHDPYILPEETLNNIKHIIENRTKSLSGNSNVKQIGNSIMYEKEIPGIPRDIEFIMTGETYDKMSPRTSGFIEHLRETDVSTTKQIIRNGSDGLADSSNEYAWEIFARTRPEEYHKVLQQSAISGTNPAIPYSAEELVQSINPYEYTILRDLTNKFHAQNIPFYYERTDPKVLTKAVLDKGKMLFGEQYKPILGIDYSNLEANRRFLSDVGYVGENPEIVARSPERMNAIVQDWYQYVSAVSREDIIPSGADAETIRKYASEWIPGAGGVFKNAVALDKGGASGSYIENMTDFDRFVNSTMQLDFNKYIQGSTPDKLTAFHKQLRGELPLTSEQQKKLRQIFEKYTKTKLPKFDNAKDVEYIMSDLLHGSDSENAITIAREVAQVLPYLEVRPIYGGQVFRGFAATPNAYTHFVRDVSAPLRFYIPTRRFNYAENPFLKQMPSTAFKNAPASYKANINRQAELPYRIKHLERLKKAEANLNNEATLLRRDAAYADKLPGNIAKLSLGLGVAGLGTYAAFSEDDDK